MISKRIIFIIITTYAALVMAIFLQPEMQQCYISSLSDDVCIRICCVARLKKLMSHLENLCVDNSCSVIAVDHSLLEQWNDFASFRYVGDREFQTKFLRKAFSAAISLLSSAELPRELQTVKVSTITSPDRFLPLFDCCTDIVCCKTSSYVVRGQFHATQYYAKERISAESVTTRLFQIRRLRRAFGVLVGLSMHKISLGDQHRTGDQTELQNLLRVIEHPRMLDAIASMIESNCVQPLLTIAQEMMQFRYIGDDRFFQEMLLAMFNAYKNLLIQYARDPVVQTRIGLELSVILQMYERIDQMSTQELLDGIDMATDHMRLILDDLDLHQPWWNHYSLFSFLQVGSVAAVAGLLGMWACWG